MQKVEIFPTFQHKVERVPHFARISEVRHIHVSQIVSISSKDFMIIQIKF